MIRPVLRGVSFDQFAIAFTVAIVVFLYYLAGGDLLRTAAAIPIPGQSGWAAASAETGPPAPSPAPETPVRIVRFAGKSEGIAQMFARIGYRLEMVREHGEVPRVFMANLPRELADIPLPEQRKVMFIKTALPLILHVNELIALDRERIVSLRDRSAAGFLLSPEDEGWLKRKADEYGLEGVDFAELLVRVDVVPPSLALAQSAEESGWGTSRFAREGNALFGQRVWQEDAGIVPLDRATGERFRVAAFDHLVDGVKSYARNLNSHPAYEKFRSLRASQRQDDSIDGYSLAGMLIRYSERGQSYVRTLRAIIRANGLHVFDRARLGDRMLSASAGAPDA